MTLRQTILKALYPLIMLKGKIFGTSSGIESNPGLKAAPASFYDLAATTAQGKTIDFGAFTGKQVLIVNTASNCGYTAQYDELSQLQSRYKNLVVVAFPSNDFKEQEKGTDEEIAAFCKIQYGISFPVVQKTKVLKGEGQHEVFKWLSYKNLNGWNDREPGWNFAKYLVNESGILTHYFSQDVSPLSKDVVEHLH